MDENLQDPEDLQEIRKIAIEYAPFLEKFNGKNGDNLVQAHLVVLKSLITLVAGNKDSIHPIVMLFCRALLKGVPDMEKNRKINDKKKVES